MCDAQNPAESVIYLAVVFVPSEPAVVDAVAAQLLRYAGGIFAAEFVVGAGVFAAVGCLQREISEGLGLGHTS